MNRDYGNDRRLLQFVVTIDMAVVSTTLCYPHSAAPTQGIFVRRRLQAIHARTPIQVVAPIPWFPFYSKSGTAAAGESPPTVRPRMPYLPRLMKRWDAGRFAHALETGLEAARRNGKVRLIDAHFVWPDAVGAWQVVRKEGLRLVCTIRGKLVSQSRIPGRRRMIAEMLRGADAVIAVSRPLAELARTVADADLNVRIIPNGVDRGDFFRRGGYGDDQPSLEDRANLGWSSSARYVVSVGHLQELKGFHRLVEIWPQVRRRCGDIRLMLVGGSAGEPRYEKKLRRAIDEVNNGEASNRQAIIQLAGHASSRRIAMMLNAADLFALATRSEGCCNAIAESLACGCPVVTTDVGGNFELIREPALGRLSPFGDPAALCETVCEALETPWNRQTIADIGGIRDWPQVAQECVGVFNEVLDS